jgi:hypothetical protein
LNAVLFEADVALIRVKNLLEPLPAPSPIISRQPESVRLFVFGHLLHFALSILVYFIAIY